VLEPEGGKIKVADKIKVEISSIDTIDRRLFVTMKNIGAEKPVQAERTRQPGKKQAPGAAEEAPVAGTIGDLIRQKLGAKIGKQEE
jgi:small subunit ribosomal protein S1